MLVKFSDVEGRFGATDLLGVVTAAKFGLLTQNDLEQLVVLCGFFPGQSDVQRKIEDT